jgi:AcrR family transcriptional regulator
MPLKKFSQEDIVEAAFKVVRAQGLEKCTARSIAVELGASTMPIYTALNNMQDLRAEIVIRASNLLLSYQTKKRTSIAFLDMGVGYVLFSQEEKFLFRMMMGDINDVPPGKKELYRKCSGYVFEQLEERLTDDALFAGLTKQQIHDVLYKAWIFSHGLAVLINSGKIEPMDERSITQILFEVGGVIACAERDGVAQIAQYSNCRSRPIGPRR